MGCWQAGFEGFDVLVDWNDGGIGCFDLGAV